MALSFGTWLLTNDYRTNVSPRIHPETSSEDFETWFLANGGYLHPSVELAASPSDGNFLRVKPSQTILSGNTVVSCPHSLALSWPSARKFHFLDVELPPVTQHVATRFFLIKQRLLKEQSPWWPYIRMLPETFNTPLYYGFEDLAWIQGTNLGRARKVREDAWRDEYDEAIKVLFPSKTANEWKTVWTWDLFLWAATVMTTRSFPGPSVFNQPEGNFPTYIDNPEGRAPVLIPGLDILNHRPPSRVAWVWDSAACTIRTDEVLESGSQVPNNYGAKSNEELIMGYGFSLAENSSDHFSIGFSPLIAAYINATKARRLEQSSIHEQQQLPKIGDKSSQEVAEDPIVHWVYIREDEPEFSPHFLEDFSIAIENSRERNKADVNIALKLELRDSYLSRNKLHVMCAVLMILQKGQIAIRKHDRSLPERPRNAKQIDAARYRQVQLQILQHAISSLNTRLSSLFVRHTDGSKDLRIVRLEEVLTGSPKRLQKDIRNVLNTGLKTRDPRKIRKRGGTDFAFTVWLCGFWIWQQYSFEEREHNDSSVSTLDAQYSRWLRFLHVVYPEQKAGLSISEGYSMSVHENDRAEWFDPVRNSALDEDVITDLASTASSYLDAIHATVDKHPKSLYNGPDITTRRLEWCLNVIRNEGVWFPNLQEAGQEEDDEWVLFLEIEEVQH